MTSILSNHAEKKMVDAVRIEEDEWMTNFDEVMKFDDHPRDEIVVESKRQKQNCDVQYGSIATSCAQEDGMTLQLFPPDHRAYGIVACRAVQQNGRALKFVPTYRKDYTSLAILAVRQDNTALEFVPDQFRKIVENVLGLG